MLDLYVYIAKTRRVVAIIHGKTNAECEDAMLDVTGGDDKYDASYSPALGTVDGLIVTSRTREIQARRAEEIPKIQINIRLHPHLIAAVDKYVREHSPEIRDRTHAIEVALTRLITLPPAQAR